MGVLSSLLSGAAFGTELGSMEEGPKPGQDGHFVAAIHIGAFEEVGRFKERMDRIVRQLRACRLAPGFERIYALGRRNISTGKRTCKRASPSRRRPWRDCSQPPPSWGWQRRPTGSSSS
jgi:LDH2 family malate/lactate/ureidoglycolate dehydrogenase